ncbi:MAG: SDR family NAD(P)-dependent oxidoreductase [Marinilabiliales bacterium]|nr:SDR family NAD(P)-dependent oxidoreductase [Marinilabiliales bacterium]
MTKKKNMNNWNIKNIPSQDGKVALVTGANSGIGYETALAFAMKKMTVILACRNFEKGQKAKNAILKSFTDAQIEVMQLDTSSLNSVKHFSIEFLKKFDRLDLLVNNAGIMMSPHGVTEERFRKSICNKLSWTFCFDRPFDAFAFKD